MLGGVNILIYSACVASDVIYSLDFDLDGGVLYMLPPEPWDCTEYRVTLLIDLSSSPQSTEARSSRCSERGKMLLA